MKVGDFVEDLYYEVGTICQIIGLYPQNDSISFKIIISKERCYRFSDSYNHLNRYRLITDSKEIFNIMKKMVFQ